MKKKERLETACLYVLVDCRMVENGCPTSDFEDILAGGVRLIQWREKNPAKWTLSEVEALCSTAHAHNALFIVNDDPKLALSIGADGVHIGQQDGDISAVRQWIGPDRILGVSAHNLFEAKAAIRMGADYLGVGAIFTSETKKNTISTPLSVLEDIVQASDVPVFAIGGVSLSRWRYFEKIAVSGAAVSGDLMKASDKKRYVQEFIKTIRNSRERRHL